MPKDGSCAAASDACTNMQIQIRMPKQIEIQIQMSEDMHNLNLNFPLFLVLFKSKIRSDLIYKGYFSTSVVVRLIEWFVNK